MRGHGEGLLKIAKVCAGHGELKIPPARTRRSRCTPPFYTENIFSSPLNTEKRSKFLGTCDKQSESDNND